MKKTKLDKELNLIALLVVLLIVGLFSTVFFICSIFSLSKETFISGTLMIITMLPSFFIYRKI